MNHITMTRQNNNLISTFFDITTERNRHGTATDRRGFGVPFGEPD